MSSYPKISVIVPSLNGKASIGNLLKSVYSQKYLGGIEIIVTDDGSTDGTSDYLKESWPKVKLIKFAKNFSWGNTYNDFIKVLLESK